MSSNLWQTAFNKDLSELQKWFDSEPQERSLLYWALKKKEISELEYLKWAQSTYNLPILSSLFFVESADPEVIKKHDYYNWSEECLPVYEWDGVLFVACISPPEHQPPNTQYVLAPLSALESWWKNMVGLQKSTKPQNTPLPPTENPPEAISHFELKSDNEIEAAPEPPTEDSDPPSGIMLMPEPTRIPLEIINSQENSTQVEAPAGLDFSTVLTSVPTPTLTTTSPVTMPPPPPPPKEAPQIAKAIEPPPPPKEALEEATMVTPPPTTQEPFVIATPEVQVKTPTPSATTSSMDDMINEILDQSPIGEAPANNSILDQVWQSHRYKFDNFLRNVFQEMHLYFNECMVLRIDGEKASPWRWDENFKKRKAEPDPISLVGNSVFRIAYKTHMPYHGYVIGNLTNDAFFNKWHGSTPEHVSIVPILLEERVVGLILGVANKDVASKASLQLLERVALQYSAKISESLGRHLAA